jgi:hypothetical protein
MVRITGLAFAVLALGLLVSGCDRCGDWYSPFETRSSPVPRSAATAPASHTERFPTFSGIIIPAE